jgi:hypothetical protein
MPAKRFLPGEIAWTDLTIREAAPVRDFYRRVVGWKVRNVSMGEYDDFGMVPRGSSKMIAGVCHARGVNADLPPVWLIYVLVKNLDRSLQVCVSMGGSVVTPPRPMGKGRMCVIRDPAGAQMVLYELSTKSKGRRSTTRPRGAKRE